MSRNERDFLLTEMRKRSTTLITLALISALMLTTITGLGASAAPSPPSNNSATESRPRPYSRQPSNEALKWADKELKRMSLDEKIGQLISVGINATFLNQDSEAFKALRHQVVDNHVGGIILFHGPVYESVVLVNRMQQLAKYPLLISADLEAGSGMRFDDTVNFPWNMAIAATGNPDYARRAGDLTGREARAMGIQQIYAPVSDVNNNAANPVINVRRSEEHTSELQSRSDLVCRLLLEKKKKKKLKMRNNVSMLLRKRSQPRRSLSSPNKPAAKRHIPSTAQL